MPCSGPQLTCFLVHLFWALTLPSRPRITASLSKCRSSVTAGIVLRRWRKFAGGGRMWHLGTEKAAFVSYGTFRGAEETGPNSVWAVT